MILARARTIAIRIRDELAPFCDRIQIAGSIRREKPDCGDIELVAVRSRSGIALMRFCEIVNSWHKIKGEPTGKYTQRLLPDGINLDLFIAQPDNFGAIMLIRTGSSEFSKTFIGYWLPAAGYRMKDGCVWKDGVLVPVPDESDMFRLVGRQFVDPQSR